MQSRVHIVKLLPPLATQRNPALRASCCPWSWMMAQQGTHSRIQPAFASPRSAAPSYYQPAPFHNNPLQQDLNPSANYPIQPHLSSPASYRQGQHVPNPLARASSSFMPPPSSLPEEINKRSNLQPQRPHNLWPQELSEEQRQIQNQYVHNGGSHA